MQTYNSRDAQIGFAAELKLINAFRVRDSTWPDWLSGIRKATRIEDINGIDAHADTTRGCIDIQIKTSFLGLQNYLLDHPGTKVVILIIKPSYTPEQVRQLTYQYVGRRWGELVSRETRR